MRKKCKYNWISSHLLRLQALTFVLSFCFLAITLSSTHFRAKKIYLFHQSLLLTLRVKYQKISPPFMFLFFFSPIALSFLLNVVLHWMSLLEKIQCILCSNKFLKCYTSYSFSKFHSAYGSLFVYKKQTQNSLNIFYPEAFKYFSTKNPLIIYATGILGQSYYCL